MSRWADEFEAEMLTRTPRANGANGAKTPQIRPFGTIGTIGTGKSDENSELDRVRVPSPPSTSEPDSQPDWDSEVRQLIDWFLTTGAPAKPFELCRGVTILDPARWWRSIEGDIEAGPNGPRARYGAVQGDLRRLYALMVGAGGVSR